VANAPEHLALDNQLADRVVRGLLKARGRQLTNSTQVLRALRSPSRPVKVAETLRVTLEASARTVPVWLQGFAPNA
jgi:hypothetical protein